MFEDGRRRCALATLAALAALVAGGLGASADAESEVVEVGGQGPPPFGLTLSPRAFSRTQQRPVKLGLTGQFNSFMEYRHPPALSQIKLLLDRHLDLSTRGLPACAPHLQIMSVAPVPRRCEPALVGSGKAEIFIGFPEGKPVVLEPEVLLYNGGTRGAATRLWIYIPISVPVPAALLAPIEIKKIDQGHYGTEAVAALPKIASGYGVFERLSLNINREYTYKDKRRSVATFRCANGKFVGSAEASFADGSVIHQDLITPCRRAG
jgi:hypothetical protein